MPWLRAQPAGTAVQWHRTGPVVATNIYRALGRVTETDTARSLTRTFGPLTLAIGRIDETDTTFALSSTYPLLVTFGRVWETNAAYSFMPPPEVGDPGPGNITGQLGGSIGTGSARVPAGRRIFYT